jgi:PAS domain S-box-containing protein
MAKAQAMSLIDKNRRSETPALARLLGEAAAARAALGACGFPLAILDATQHARPVTYVNPAFEAYFGWRADEAMGRGLGAVVFKGDEAQVHRLLAELSSRRPVKAWAKDGSSRPVELAIGPLQNAEGRVTHFVVAFSDRSELERLRAQLDSLQTLAAAA